MIEGKILVLICLNFSILSPTVSPKEIDILDFFYFIKRIFTRLLLFVLPFKTIFLENLYPEILNIDWFFLTIE